ncbi:MAG: VWA domain-containing protein, partial [Planctomycetota bacterium]
AAEALAPPWRGDALAKVAARLAEERHPVVSQALVRTLLAMLRTADGGEPDARDAALAQALQQFGRCGWRTDMDLLDLVEAFPRKAAIPVLIAALDLELRSPDALVTAINKRASPLLRERASGLLRAMTGALVLGDDPAAWREFWAREQDKIVVPRTLAKPRSDGTRAQFFGVPVTGGAIAFLIDTSGSMAYAPGGAPATGPRRRSSESRLAAAKEQLGLCVQAMPPESTYSVFTFAERGRSWTATPCKPGPQNLRSLTELLSRFHARGGTNLHDGLVQALQFGERRHGEVPTSRIDELFVLSDGEPTSGPVQAADDLLAIVREANKYAKVRIHAVFTGTGTGSDLLRRLAEENGGVYVQR